MSLEILVKSMVGQSPLCEISQDRLDGNILPKVKSAFEIAGIGMELLTVMTDSDEYPEIRLRAVERAVKDMLSLPKKAYWKNSSSILLALSVMNYLGSQLYQKNRERLMHIHGKKVNSEEMDINYRGGVNDYIILFKTRRGGENPEIFFDKSRLHFHRSREIWEATRYDHVGIAYRHARAADVYWHLYKLSGNGDYLRKARGLIDDTDLIIGSCFIPIGDLKAIKNIKECVLDSH